MDELAFFKKQVSDLDDENRMLKSEMAFLKGKLAAYERFLQLKGYIKTELNDEGGEEGCN